MRGEPKHRISERALRVWRIDGMISSCVYWLGFFVVLGLTFAFHWPYWISMVTFVLSVFATYLLVWLFPALRWKRWRYDVHEHEIEVQHGIYVIKRTIIPMVRVQHVDMKQGPLLRKYRLATISIWTAATVHEIPALDVEEAEALRDRISVLARMADSDE
ncbi:PH domain-containing protein [Thermaerobacillus caldiproteolyticus]|uniref:YdbS-like PH domain-containing protein n=1 Tax=Thermaerobacillus caldiproteolyticus TaxID=247480 RepID=A0A7W0C109_9BACL|nr:PH domain-containing protein [Anoxybacillus caldiproteolyticus]MBA2876354.1 hypothetical protein [Anoxybacillus caldiproteolyticus]QPA31178.1 PH domain-containing protein [Anoxybacillus caldiproteolyticus]